MAGPKEDGDVIAVTHRLFVFLGPGAIGDMGVPFIGELPSKPKCSKWDGIEVDVKLPFSTEATQDETFAVTLFSCHASVRRMPHRVRSNDLGQGPWDSRYRCETDDYTAGCRAL